MCLVPAQIRAAIGEFGDCASVGSTFEERSWPYSHLLRHRESGGNEGFGDDAFDIEVGVLLRVVVKNNGRNAGPDGARFGPGFGPQRNGWAIASFPLKCQSQTSERQR